MPGGTGCVPIKRKGNPSMTTAKTGNRVQVHYKGSAEEGVVFDTTPEDQPLEFIIGDSKILPAFSEAVIGMQAGDGKTIQLTAEQAYGEVLEEMIITVNRSELPSGRDLAVGQSVQARDADGHQHDFIIMSIEGSKIVLDGNHPLAGKELHFDVKVVSLREATQEEMEHGHVHSGDHHHH